MFNESGLNVVIYDTVANQYVVAENGKAFQTRASAEDQMIKLIVKRGLSQHTQTRYQICEI